MESEKRDFENLDVRLYLALKAVLPYAENESSALHVVAQHDDDPVANAEADKAANAVESAQKIMRDFEDSHGPLPDWAIGRNFGYELVPGAQLCTKDGRRTGNAHIIRHGAGIAAGPVHVPTFECLTDAGHKTHLTEREIESEFYVGDWISDPKEVVKKFDRQGHFKDL